ncbi:MAG TPA: hypothetical protein VNA22_09785 [Pyrinomonadaceae bacterium]|nr:hypothetical protein [Pyrinomonadaceae bacterium]
MIRRFVLAGLIASVLIATTVKESAAAYEWVNRAPAGNGCFPPKCVEGQFPMAVMPVPAFDGKLWSVGQSAVWSSHDGTTWRSEPKTDWGERHGMEFVFFRNKLWMLAGMRSWADFRNDVWSSSDGKKWTQITVNAPWSARRGHRVVVFNDRLWLLGGAVSSGRVDQTPTGWLNDIWASEDGVRWTQVTASAAWPPRGDHSAFAFDGKLWVVGTPQSSDVWSSADGKKWTRMTEKAPWGIRQGNGTLVFDERMWIIGGRELNDVWSSKDGKSWEAERNAPWSTRSAIYSVVFNGGIWLFSGKTGREDSWAGDIWEMRRSGS